MTTDSQVVADLIAKAAEIKTRIDAACRRAGRDPVEVRLIWVGKNHPAESLRAAHAAGARLFGENRVQEVLEKFPLRSPEDQALDHELHFIGHLQSNKIRKVLPLCSAIHSVHSPDLWQALNRVAGEIGIRRDVFLQVNTTGEERKSGFAAETFVEAAASLPPAAHLNLVGLMTMGPAENAGPEASRPCFRELRRLLEKLGQRPDSEGKFRHLRWLSMGMTSDYEAAVEEGAHFLRIGTALFGSRSG